MNDVIKTIHDRRSIGKLTLPMPSLHEISQAIESAMTAPDHKQLTPWRFCILTNQALDDFGQVLLQAGLEKATREGVTLDDATKTKLINMPKRAPMIVTVSSKYQDHDKVPEFEQLLSCGAAVQNLLLSLASMGYQSVWRTGDLCNEPSIKAFFGVDERDVVCGFVYIGSSDVIMPPRTLPNVSEFARFLG